MDCQQAREKLYDRLFDLLESTEQAALDQHLANCPACARALEQAKRETALLEHWTAPLAPESLVNQTLAAARESATHAAPAEQPAAMRRPVSREPVWGWFTWRRYWATVTAVFALVAVVAGAQTVACGTSQSTG